MFYRFITAICFALITFVGQAKSVSGVVIDEHTKEALPGVYVTLVNDSAKVLFEHNDKRQWMVYAEKCKSE